MRTKNKSQKITNIKNVFFNLRILKKVNKKNYRKGLNFFYLIPIIFILSSNIIAFDNQYINFTSQNENLDAFKENIPIAQDPLTSENFYTRFNQTWSNDASSMKTTLFLDLDDDGDLEMLRRIGNYQTEIYTLNQSGYQNVTTIPIDVIEYADYDGDGVKEFIGRPETNYDYYFYNFTLDGGILNHEETWITGYDDRGAITCGDLEGDGKAEFIYYDNGIQYGGTEGRYRLISYDSGSFSELQSFDDVSTQGWDGYASGTLIDIDGDGLDEIVCSWGYGSNFDGGIRIYDDYLHSYSLMQQYQFERDPLFLSPFDDHEDLNNDGADDLVVGIADTFVDHYRYIIWYNSTTSSFSYQKLTKQPNTRYFGVGYLDEGDDYARYASFYCPDPATNQYWTDRIRVYQWDTFELGNPFEIMLNYVYSNPAIIKLTLRDINGDGFDEIIFDGRNEDNKQVTFFFFNNQTLAPDEPLLQPTNWWNAIFNDDYESYTVNTFPSAEYTLLYNGAGDSYQKISDSYAYAGSQSFTLKGQPSWTALAVKSFSYSKTIIAIEANVMTEAIGGTQHYNIEFDLENPDIGTWGTQYSSIAFRYDGKIVLKGGTSEIELADFTPFTWYNIRLEVNTRTDYAKAFIDGLLVDETDLIRDSSQISHAGLASGWLGIVSYFDNFEIQEINEEISLSASFNTNTTTISEGDSIQFTDLTTGGDLPLSYQWNFGDGTPNATDQNPIHQYNSSGTYSAILTVIDNDGDISVSESLSISVISIDLTNGIWQSISAGINAINCIDDDGILWMSVYLDVQGDGLIRLTHSSSNPSAISTPTEAECSHFYSIEISDSSVISEKPTINFFFPDDEYTESQKEQLSIYNLGSVNWTEISSTLFSSENKIYVSNGEVDSLYSLGYSMSDDTPTDTDDGPFVIPGYPMWILGSISLGICILKILNIDYLRKKKRNKGINI